jgi:hypothetical protein
LPERPFGCFAQKRPDTYFCTIPKASESCIALMVHDLMFADRQRFGQ